MHNNNFYYNRKTSGKAPKPISGVIAQVVQSLGLKKNYDGWMVVTNWADIVGSTVAKQAKAVNFEDGCLFVAVEDPAWRQELALKTEEILKKIHDFPYGKTVKQIRLIGGRKG
ncbi:MAG: DUF721 domain-containing protein [FCB group bacterium]|nr:DUF721 domain-containing protein [FCB group bacterium]